jgi:hypothetical protein
MRRRTTKTEEIEDLKFEDIIKDTHEHKKEMR